MSSVFRLLLKDTYSNFYALHSETQVSSYTGKANFYGLFMPHGHDSRPVSNLPHACVKEKCFTAGSTDTYIYVR